MKSTKVCLIVLMITVPSMAGVSFETADTPITGSFATSLASDGSYIYFADRGFAEFYRSDDGDSWDWLWPQIFDLLGDTGNWYSGIMAFYPDLGSQGSMLIRHYDDVVGLDKIAVYDIAGDYWYWLGPWTWMSHGTVVVGDHLYGVAHALGGNFGGPICRVNLASPLPAEERSVLTGITGSDSGWFSRVAHLAEVGGLIYGIKNDWVTEPSGTGDRLFRFDPASFGPSTFTGDPNDPLSIADDANWTAGSTPATDLSDLPFECGYGSALVALPANWSQEIGAAGGLFIIAGCSPANHEGWGAPSGLFALYDVATGTYTVSNLPNVTGYGTSACLHDGKVIIKRGGVPDNPYDDTVWIATGTVTNPCGSPQTLTVGSSPVTAITIAVSPPDCDGLADGATPFSRNVGLGDYVSLTAPVVPGYQFIEWQVNGSFATDLETVVVEMGAPAAAEAVYQLRCDTPVAFDVLSSPVTGIEVGYEPADCDGLSGQTTPFTTNVGLGETVTFVAPCVDDYRFSRWIVSDPNATTEVFQRALTLEIDDEFSAEAVYEAAPPPYVVGSLTIETLDTPIDSEFASALASDGTYTYYLRRNSHQLFRSADGCIWTELKGVTDDLGSWHGDWNSGMLAYYDGPGSGSTGSLISRHRYPTLDPWGNVQEMLVRYDIATDTWSWLPTFTVMSNGAAIAGEYIYGVWHAGGDNYGGPICRAHLATPESIDERTFFDLSSILGDNANWYSRICQFATLDGMVYGIKNDWYTEPAGTGDRLYMFDPADFWPADFAGGNPWNTLNWAANPTFPYDLGQLPFECGYGAALVALPPHWSDEVGADGGLFIVAGRSPSNHEGWGDPSDQFAIFDVASGTFSLVGALPDVTGSGASATLHDGKVFIKRGASPEGTYNADLWVVTPSGGGCPNPGASGAYCTADIDGSADCLVNLADLAELLGTYNKCPGDFGYNPSADLTDDGNPCIGLSDLATLLAQYGDDCN